MTARRQQNNTLAEQLRTTPQAFPFFQAVRLLERLAAFGGEDNPRLPRHPVARFAPPETEALRFHTRSTLDFPASEVTAIDRRTVHTGLQQWSVVVDFLGLTGVTGVLPYHYTEMMLQRLKIKDPALKAFFDLFNHRTLSLFFQAGSKYRLPLEYERKKLNPPTAPRRDTHTQAMLSMIGLGTGHLAERLYTTDESLLYYGGLLSQKVRGVNGLQRMIEHRFNIPVRVKQFVGQWQDLITDVRSRLPDAGNKYGQNVCLGRSTMLGRRGWFAQGKIRIVIGPLNREQLHTFSPGTRSLKALNELVRLYVGMELDYDFVIRIRRADIPQRVTLSAKQAPVVGWNTWLAGSESVRPRDDESVDISVPASKLQ
jgi:type VI secretion system protein ImpH